jgi:hypothetical protein
VRSFRASFLHLRWLACLLAVLLLFGQQGALRHALSHWSEGGSEIGAALQPAGKTAALAAALPVLVVLRLRTTRRWHFPHVGVWAGTPVFPVAVCSRDPPFGL